MKKDWILTIGIDKYRLTEEQKNFYLRSIQKGAKFVEIEGNFFGNSFQTLVNEEVVEEAKMIEQGKWKCEYGKWHFKGSSCGCKYELVVEDGVAKRVLKIPNTRSIDRTDSCFDLGRLDQGSVEKI